jgi:diguanylate cyclase (GGDEF)-like protein/PAS domain S-box-containing protein
VNRSFLKILGYDHPEEVIGKHIHELIHHSHPDGSPYPPSECKVYNAYRHKHEIHVSDEVFWKKDGTAIPVEYWSKPLPVDNVLQGAIATFIDITDRKLAEEQIRQLAFYDSLTKVANRCLLNDRLDQTIVASKRTSRYGALMFLDLDNFKLLNDTHGHEVGDELLIEAARRIGSCIRETDTVARFGGDEFVVLLGELNEDQSDSTVQAGNVAEKIRTLMSEPYRLLVKQDGNEEITVEHHCTSSIGVAVFNHQASREDILKWADMAMYEAKKAGRNCVVFNKQCSSKTGMDQKRPG